MMHPQRRLDTQNYVKYRALREKKKLEFLIEGER
jgi:hypothetical protein